MLGAQNSSSFEGAPSFSLKHRLLRLTWIIVWKILASWTPPLCSRWRLFLLALFGAEVHPTANVYGSCRIWYPPNLKMAKYSTLGPNVNCYSMGNISLKEYAIVSQGAYLCTGTHQINSPEFQLYTRPIVIGANSWVCADAFVGPGVTVCDGAVLSARAAAFRDLDAWSVYQGNPAKFLKYRTKFER